MKITNMMKVWRNKAMIIVSQDKDTITNFNNIEIMGIGNPLEDNEGQFRILVNTTSENQYTIAKYKTEERAKEVLQEIVNEYGKYLKIEGAPAIIQGSMDIQPNIFNIPKVYYMPRE